MTWRRFGAATAAIMAIAGCGVAVQGDAVPAIDISASLPFTPTISERVNGRNDGSSFEPCNAYSVEELRGVGIDPGTISDAAISDSPNYRGCHWSPPERKRNFSQIVGDEPSLDYYKRKYSPGQWNADRSASGRAIGILADSDSCTAVFESEDAVVITIVTNSTDRQPSPGLTEECDKAFAFASLAASKAP